jgi:CheY-like chemotaxis protein
MMVRDTGVGMTEETKNRIFDPFFTTKPDGHGTGLGLSTVHGIVTQSGGRILVSTQLGHGTSFLVYLPRAAKSKDSGDRTQGTADRTQNRQNLLTMSRKFTETILLAEDEADLRGIVETMLRMQGYTVLTAKDGQDAVLLAQTHRGSIDLLLTDVMMPRKNGVEAAELIRKIRPNISVIYMTGYAEQTLSMGSTDALLEKPVPPPVLFDKIREILAVRMGKQTA